jgi:tetratricopeptide (TPR) repeat protein
VTRPFKSDEGKTPDTTSSDSAKADAARHFGESAGLFFNKQDGVFLLCLLLFGLTLWTFVPALNTDFQYYDESGEMLVNPHENTGLSWQNLKWSLTSLEYSNWYPLTRISHMVDFKLFGKDPWGHHLTNVLLHAANGVLLFLVLRRMSRALWRSLIVAALFALHPLRVESVAWITERKDVLCAFFGLLALWNYARYSEESKTQGGRPKLFYGLTLLFFAFSLMSKSMLVTFPFLLLLLDFWPLQRWRQKSRWSLVMEKAPFLLLIMPVSIATYFAQKAGDQFMFHFPLGFRLETALMGYGRYLEKMFWPTNLSVLYPYPAFWPVGQLLCAMALLLGISILAIALWRQRPYLLTGWLWFLGTLVPVIGFLPLGAQSMSNRYSYIPMMGILVLLVWAVDDLSKRWRQRAILMATVVTLVLGLCIFRTRAEIVYWKDAETLWSRAVAVTTNNFMAHYCLANTMPTDKALNQVAELQKSVDIYSNYFDAQFVLGKFLLVNRRYSEAIGPFESAIRLEPQNGWAYHDLGATLYKLSRVSDAVPFLLKAIEIEPQNAGYKEDFSGALFSANHEASVSNFLATMRADPAGFGNFFEAMKFDTNRAVFINNLAWYFATNPDPGLRNGKYAILLAARVCEMTGFKSHSAVLALAAAYAEDSRFDDAISIMQLAGSLASAAGQPGLVTGDQALLELFRSHQTYHEAIEPLTP